LREESTPGYGETFQEPGFLLRVACSFNLFRDRRRRRKPEF
jgi:hypothetical protein